MPSFESKIPKPVNDVTQSLFAQKKPEPLLPDWMEEGKLTAKKNKDAKGQQFSDKDDSMQKNSEQSTLLDEKLKNDPDEQKRLQRMVLLEEKLKNDPDEQKRLQRMVLLEEKLKNDPDEQERLRRIALLDEKEQKKATFSVSQPGDSRELEADQKSEEVMENDPLKEEVSATLVSHRKTDQKETTQSTGKLTGGSFMPSAQEVAKIERVFMKTAALLKSKKISKEDKIILVKHYIFIKKALRKYRHNLDSLYQKVTHGQQLALVRPQPVKPTAPGGMEIVISLLAIWQNIHSITMSGKELKEFQYLGKDWTEVTYKVDVLADITEKIDTDDKPKDDCEPMPVPHRGGDAFHNMCADLVPPNVYPGYDVMVKGKSFDALGPHKTLWEIKTGEYSKWNKFVKMMELGKTIPEARREDAFAKACGYEFILAVTDREYFNVLDKHPTMRGMRVIYDGRYKR